MRKIYLKGLVLALLSVLTCTQTDAQTRIRLRTTAKAGTDIRIQGSPYGDVKVSGGASEGRYFGTYTVTDPSKDIVITGPVTELECYGCSLSELNIDKADSLTILRCYNNSLQKLDLKNAPNLEILDCKQNALTSLDVAMDPKLEQLNCSGNQLQTLTLGSSQTNMTRLECGNNKLTALDLSACPALTDLYAENNSLTKLDVSKNKSLNWIKVFGNKIGRSAMTDFIASLPETTQGTSLLYVVDTRNPDEGNQCYQVHVIAAAQKGWFTCDNLGGTDTGDMTGYYYSGLDYKPVYSNSKITLTTSHAVGDKITLDLTSYRGRDFKVDGVAEAAPYVGKQTYTLTSQTLTITGDISKLNCSGDQITSLTFNDDSCYISELDCSNNELTSLNVSDLSLLTNLRCQQNKLQSLMAARCDTLQRIDCYRNDITGLYMTALVQSLYKDNNKNNPVIFIIDTQAPSSTPEGNVCTDADVKTATGKGWSVKDYINGGRYGFGRDYSGSEQKLPEQYFTIRKASPDYVSIAFELNNANVMPVLEGAEISSFSDKSIIFNMTADTTRVYGDFKTLTILYSQLTGLDVSHEPNLEQLNCGLNDLTTLDVSKNPKLQVLSCEMNLLTSLDLSANTQLDYLNVYGNKIAGSNMTSLVNSLPLRPSNSKGVFVVVDGTLSSDGNVCTVSDVQKATAKNWTAYDLNGAVDAMKPYAGTTTGISSINAETSASKVVFISTLDGRKISQLQRGVNIVKYADGETRKVLVK